MGHPIVSLISLILMITGGITWWSSLNKMKPGVDLSCFSNIPFRNRELFADGGYRRYITGVATALTGVFLNGAASLVSML